MSLFTPTQPKETTNVREFLKLTRRSDARFVKYKKPRKAGANSSRPVRFKLRLSKYLVTLKVADPVKAAKIRQSLPPGKSGLS